MSANTRTTTASLTDPVGNTTAYDYNEEGNPIYQRYPNAKEKLLEGKGVR